MEVNDISQLMDAAKKIEEITTGAKTEHSRYINEKGEEVLEQISDYLFETLKPLLEEDTNKSWDIKLDLMIETYNLTLKWYYNGMSGDPGVRADFVVRGGFGGSIWFYKSCALVKKGHMNDEDILVLTSEWKMFKSELNRKIDKAFSDHRERKRKEVERHLETSKMLDEFEI